MRRLTSTHQNLDGAWVEIPDEWTSGDYDLYIRAYAATLDAGHSHPTGQLAGVLALIQEGRVQADVPGVSWDDDQPDIGGLKAEALGFLRHVATLLEATQVVPFEMSSPSADGTIAAGEKS